MNTEYSAVVMKKIEMDKYGTVVFKPLRIISGDIKNDEYKFVTEKGIEYITINDYNKDNSHINFSVAYIIKNKELLKECPDLTLEEAREALLESAKARLMYGFIFEDFNKIGISYIEIAPIYNKLYNACAFQIYPRLANNMENEFERMAKEFNDYYGHNEPVKQKNKIGFIK
ncbi:MAG: hypothetical protein RRY22_05425 [Bacilli bacterium]